VHLAISNGTSSRNVGFESLAACHNIIAFMTAVEKSGPSKMFHTSDNEGDRVMRFLSIGTTLLLAATTASAQTPIPRSRDSCPTDYYRSGDYCKPTSSSSANSQTAIVKSGSKCPTGFYSSGDYCKRMSSSNKQALPREDGGKCPTGWYRSGGYCVRSGE
jgi:hypothetical protein